MPAPVATCPPPASRWLLLPPSWAMPMPAVFARPSGAGPVPRPPLTGSATAILGEKSASMRSNFSPYESDSAVTRAQPKTYQVTLPDVALQVTEWPGESDPVLLLHRHRFSQPLLGQHRPSDARRSHIRGGRPLHGGSDRHGEVDWLLMASDIEVLLDQLDLNRVVGVGHSMGGYLMAYVGACQLRRFRQLVLIDPVILPRQLYAQLFVPVDSVRPADSPVSRRKNQWRDAGEMYERFRDRPPFSSWQDQVLRDYCDYALREVPQESALPTGLRSPARGGDLSQASG